MKQCNNNPQPKQFNILLNKAELIYDIETACYAIGHVMPSENNPHAAHTVQDVAQQAYANRTERIIDAVFYSILQDLAPWTKKEAPNNTTTDNLPPQTDNYVVPLTVPNNYNLAQLRFLTSNIHEYIVSQAVAQWMLTAHPDKNNYTLWQNRADTLLQNIKNSLHTPFDRSKTRIRPHWY